MEFKLDKHDLKLLALLQADARITHAALGRFVHLSQPAVSERIKRLEAIGVITGYRTQIDPAKLGYRLNALVRIKNLTGHGYEELLQELPEVIECHAVTGEDGIVVRVLATDCAHLQRLIESLARIGPTSTALVLGTPVPHKIIDAPA